MILGVDCWNVIFQTPTGIPLPCAIESLRKLAASGKFEKIYIVSKVDPIAEIFSKIVFHINNFENSTGIPKSNIFFCRAYEDKAVIAEKLGITHFIDDRLRVLQGMTSVQNLYAFNPKKKDFKKYPQIVPQITIIKTWGELLPLLLE